MSAQLRPELFDFHGVSMSHFFTDNWDNIQNFQAKPDDVYIASYPKAGNTWTCYILDLLYFGPTTTPIPHRVPNLEINIVRPPQCKTSKYVCLRAPGTFHVCETHRNTDPGKGRAGDLYRGTDAANNMQTSPRLIRTHLPVQFIPKSVWEQNSKIVYVARNAKDSVVSYFHFERMSLISPEPGEWNDFVQRFMDGKMVFGSWYDHVNNWWMKKQTHAKLHFMFYEDIIEDTRREINKLCSFLGLSPSPEKMEMIIDKVKFENMKTNDIVNNKSFQGLNFKISSFMRKGKVGDWKNHFTMAQNEEFEEDYKKKMENSTLQFRCIL